MDWELDIEKFNIVLLAKWKWRLGVKNEGLWNKILNAKYRSWRNLNGNVTAKLVSWWWKGMSIVCGKGQNGNWFDNIIEWGVGQGNKTKFWEDKWVEQILHSLRFPRLFAISNCKEKIIGQLGEWRDERWVWNLLWRKERFLWESDQENELMHIITNQKLEGGRENTWCGTERKKEYSR